MTRARLGQHFLHDRTVLRAIADALEIVPGDTIIEIGAGHGELTDELQVTSERVGNTKIIAIEKDPTLATLLRNKYYVERNNFQVIEGDIRKVLLPLTLSLSTPPSSLATHRSPLVYKVCGNIPYYLTGFLLRLVGELVPLPVRTVFTMQKEVAERIVAEPPHMNQLAASVQFWAKPKIVAVIPRSAFSPPPEVASAVIVLETCARTTATRIDADTYYAAVHALFRQPRKTLLNNIADATGLPKGEVGAALEKAGAGSAARPHNLSLAQISALAARFAFPPTETS